MMHRPLTQGDVPAMAALDAKCFGPEAWSSVQLGGSMHLPTTQSFGFFDGDTLVAFFLAQKVADEIEILTICVDPAFRRQGLAQTMIKALTEQGLRVYLDVAEDNFPARRLYEQCGFTLYGRRPGYYDRKTGRVDALNYRYLVNR